MPRLLISLALVLVLTPTCRAQDFVFSQAGITRLLRSDLSSKLIESFPSTLDEGQKAPVQENYPEQFYRGITSFPINHPNLPQALRTQGRISQIQQTALESRLHAFRIMAINNQQPPNDVATALCSYLLTNLAIYQATSTTSPMSDLPVYSSSDKMKMFKKSRAALEQNTLFLSLTESNKQEVAEALALHALLLRDRYKDLKTNNAAQRGALHRLTTSNLELLKGVDNKGARSR